tara:strand:+ start:3404 stop:3544 length:141 start_codon:yes stop_codon:yes gene_type:complete
LQKRLAMLLGAITLMGSQSITSPLQIKPLQQGIAALLGQDAGAGNR